jgi:transposase-like protein
MRTIFSGEDLAKLRQNPCVFNCTERSVNYTYEFKRRALELYAEGVSAKEVWRRAGFDVSKWKKHYFRLTIRDWRRIVERDGLEGLTRQGGIQFDRGPREETSDKMKRLELQVRYLQAENDFLAELRAKRAESNSGRARNTGSSEN